MIENREVTNDVLPILEEAPDYTNLKPCLVMPTLTPAPKIFENSCTPTFSKEDSDSIVNTATHLPFRKRRQSFHFDHESRTSNDKKETPSVVTEQVSKFKPRIKVTKEDFNRISNIGYCCHSDGTSSFKCYSDWCNFKAKSKEKFLKHIRDHHGTDFKFYKYNYCHSCQVLIWTENIEKEF
jgi:hypothetical protein